MWESILYPPIFTKTIDIGLSFLFNWKTKNISVSQKLAAYPHLYSFTSTKSVVHWFQIIRTKSFQMYDDEVPLRASSKYTKVARYPTRNIRTPIVLVYGGSDSLVDIRVMLRELPRQTVATEIPHYEHLDFLWARDVDVQVFQHVFDALESFTDAEHSKEEYARYRSARHQSLSASASFRRHIGNNSDATENELTTVISNTEEEHPQHQAREAARKGLVSDDESSYMTDQSALDATSSRPTTSYDGVNSGSDRPSPISPVGSLNPSLKYRSASGSSLNKDSMRQGKGISLGTSRAVGGVTTGVTSTAAVGIPSPASSDEGKTSRRKGR